MIAFLEARRAGLFARGQWLPNVIAGVIVGVVALPLAMAFAIASGARPEQGLYTAIIGGACVSLLGGSRVQIAGPTGAFVAILAGITARYGISGLETATLMAGIILVLMGAAKMGTVIRLSSLGLSDGAPVDTALPSDPFNVAPLTLISNPSENVSDNAVGAVLTVLSAAGSSARK